MLKNLGTKDFRTKVSNVPRSVDELRTSARKVGDAAESQVTLNIALTAVCVTALLVAALLVHEVYRGRNEA